jgi:hypothetical protein
MAVESRKESLSLHALSPSDEERGGGGFEILVEEHNPCVLCAISSPTQFPFPF